MVSPALAAGFGPWDADACAEANYVGYTAAEMRGRWSFLRSERYNDAGLPDVMVVKLSYAAPRAEDLSDFVRRFDAGAPVAVRAAATTDDSADDADKPHDCTWCTVRLKLGESVAADMELDLDVRAVSNPSARVGELTVPHPRCHLISTLGSSAFGSYGSVRSEPNRGPLVPRRSS